MAFRDDDEAAFAQLEAVKKEAEDERLRHAEEQEQLRQKVGKLKKKLRDKNQQDPQKRARRVMMVSMACLALGGVLMGYFMSRDSAKDRSSKRRAKAKPLEQVFKKKPKDALEQAEYFAERAYPKSERGGLMALIAGAYLRLGDTRRARELMDRGQRILASMDKVATSPRDLTFRASAYLTMACVHGLLGQKTEAATQRKSADAVLGAVLSYAVELKATSEAATRCHLLGDRAGATALLTRAAAAANKLNNRYSRRRELQKLADMARELGDKKLLADIARVLRLQISALGRRSQETLFLLAELAWRGGDRGTAKEYVDQAMERPPRDSRRMAALGRILAITGRATAAREWLVKAVERARGDAHFSDSTRVSIIHGYAALGDAQKAASMCLSSRHYQALIREHLLAGRSKEALKLVGRLSKGRPDLSLCLALARAGRTEEALAMARKRPGKARQAEALALVQAVKSAKAEAASK